ncbi:hypothetical protein KGF56_002848 [Candida oxycetoniae]|uniref:UBC core domain-containing protein n=1 Tax=Candida oxycetoniae TaxID=497107 RepID=A0AAI9SWF1_9ASCO|nr:uncharacterized protein KGF56_002848 [Candida oxycetoniae]KAI3404328.2 hypothetical protein KGF56_002848 [Candida oxycetoniae]
MSRHPYQKRLLKEYQGLTKSQLQGIKLISNDDTLTYFLFQISVSNHSLYPDNYLLSICITREYPVDAPSVKFVKQASSTTTLISPIPVHPHIYSNGHICLNLLGDDWTPACSIETILLSIQSMLDTNDLNERPPDNQQYILRAPQDPKKSRFIYHDDNV